MTTETGQANNSQNPGTEAKARYRRDLCPALPSAAEPDRIVDGRSGGDRGHDGPGPRAGLPGRHAAGGSEAGAEGLSDRGLAPAVGIPRLRKNPGK